MKKVFTNLRAEARPGSVRSALLLCLCVLIFFSLSAVAQSPTAPALNFNVFLQKGANLINNETEGPVAMGGDLTLSQNSYQVSTNYPGTFKVNNVPVTLVIGGTVNYNGGNGISVNQNGYVKIGSAGASKVWYTDNNNAYSPIRITPGSDYNGSPRINLQANSQQLGVSANNNPVFQSGVIDFATAFTQMQASSKSIGACTDNAVLTDPNGNVLSSHSGLPNQVKINLQTGTNVLNISGSDLNAVQQFTYNNRPDASHVLVINVNAAGTFNWTVWNSGGVGLQESRYILYNFYNTTTLNITAGNAVEGTVFAPFADIVKTGNQSNIEGQVIAQSYLQNGGENHYAVFDPGISGCAVSCNLSLSGTQVNVSCFGSANGAINVTASGANGAVSYLWNDNVTTEDRTGLVAGSYSVQATDSKGCKAGSSVFIITQPSAISVSGTTVNTSTVGGKNGSIDVSVSGGTSPYTYKWSDSSITAEDRTGLKAGTYTVTVTDKNGCSANKTFVISDPTCNLSVTGTKTDVSCFGSANGSINITASGANGAVSYLWNDNVTTEDRTGLAAGNYSVQVSDAAGCKVSGNTFTIQQPTAIIVTGTTINATTVGGRNGSIDVTVSGGTPSYTYMWNDGATIEDRSGLAAGNYNVTVTDKNGCSTNKVFVITQPVCNLSVAGTQANITCFGSANGSINITATSSNEPISYLWNDSVTTEDRNGLSSGNYSVQVSDAAGCRVNSAVYTISQPSAIGIGATTIDATTVGGKNGSIDITVTGGTSPYTYKWNDGIATEDRTGLSAGSYSVVVTDKNGCTSTRQFTISDPVCNLEVTGIQINVSCFGSANGSINITANGANGAVSYLWNDNVTTEDRTGLAAGSYSVKVSDAAGCKASSAVFVIAEPAAIAISGTTVNATTVGGKNGSIDVTVSGGTSPYTYKWSDGATAEDRTGLAAGSYTVTVTDKNGCSNSKGFTITEPGCNLSATATKTNVSCNGAANGSINVTPAGNNGTMTYLWNDGTTTEDRTGLKPGSYCVQITDAAGCKVTTPMYVITEPTAIGITGKVVNTTTVGGKNGSIDITVSGGTAPYTYKWSDGPTTEDRTGLKAGTYTVTVTDKNGCSNSQAFTVGGPSCNITLTNIVTPVCCYGGNDGKIDLTVSGNTGSVNYLWSDSVKTEDRTSLTAGTYSVKVTDAVGCSASAKMVVQQPQPLAGKATTTGQTSAQTCNGTAKLSATGGTAPYTFTWSDGYVGASRCNLCMGAYDVTVKDSKGCTSTFKVKIACPNESSKTAVTALASATTAVNAEVSLSPNPTTGLVRVTINAAKAGNAAIAVYDLTGKALVQSKMSLATGSNQQTIDISAFTKGLYQVRIVTEAGSKIFKVILQ